MASRGPCRRVWLCATEDKTDICYRHYHTCNRGEGHTPHCECGSGLGHDSAHRVGEIMGSVTDAYAEMVRIGWRP